MRMSSKGKSYKGGANPSVEVGVSTKRYKGGGKSQHTSPRRVVDPKGKS